MNNIKQDKSLQKINLKKFFLSKTRFIVAAIVLILITNSGHGQTTILSDACSATTAGWTFTNNVTTNTIQQSGYWLVDAGATSDVIITPNIDVSSYTNLVLTMQVATYGSGTANPAKIEYSTNGGISWSATTYTTATPSSSSYIASGNIALGTLSTTTLKIKITNNGTSGRGVRIKTILLVGDFPCTNPTITVQPGGAQTVCTNGTLTPLSVTASPATGYQWYSNTTTSTIGGTLISGATNSTYTPSTTATSALYYYCVISNVSAACTTTSTISGLITVQGPAITGAQTLTVGSATTLSGSPAGGTWSSSTPAIATINASGIVNGITAGTTVITYTAAGCSNTFTVTVTAPGSWVQIESILVDACCASGANEGKNEMVHFVTENSPVCPEDLRVDGCGNCTLSGIDTAHWTTANAFFGWLTPTDTAWNTAVTKVNQINASIVNCGYLKMVTGCIPPHKHALIITSFLFEPFANNFSTLSDTLYVLFQNGILGGGNFSNGSTANEWMILRLSHRTAGYTEDVTWLRSQLNNTNGEGVMYTDTTHTINEHVTYYNNGCQAPYTVLTADWTAPAAMCPDAGVINLNTLVTGTAGGTWSGTGVIGSTFDPSSLNGTDSVTYTVGNPPCQITQSHNITVNSTASPTFTNLGPYCVGTTPDTLSTTSNNSLTGTWSPATISTATAGTVNYIFTPTTGQCAINYSMPITVTQATINCPPTFNVAACNGAIPAGATTPANFVTLGGTTNGTSISYIDGAPSLAGCTETTVRTYTATLNGCTNACAQNIIRNVDTQVPVFTSIPADVTVACTSDVPAANIASVIATDNCAGALTITSNDVITAGACANKFTIARTYIATDACGNASSQMQTITVNDNIAPVITFVPADVTVASTGDVPVANIASVIATDNCAGALTITSNDVITAGACANKFTIARTYTATDACGNASSQTQTITVNDNIAPVITSCPVDQTYCSIPTGNYSIPTISATDNCTGAVTYSYTITDSTSRIGVGSDASGDFNIGTSTITWSVTDACGNISSCITLVTINETPTLALTSTTCASDLSTYDVVFTSTSGVITASAGTIVGNTITGIPAGTDIIITADNLGCITTLNVTAPNCTCPPMIPPANPNNPTICVGDATPALTVDLPAVGYQINWYTVSSGGTPIVSNTYTPTDVMPGTYTYYAELEETLSECKSNRTPVILTINALPTLVCPPTFNVIACNGAIPVGANTPADFVALGGTTNGTSISYIDGTPSLVGCTETTVRTYTATLNGCTATCTQNSTRTFVSTAPVVPTNGSSTVACISAATAPSTPSISDACGNNLTPVLVSTVDNPSPLTCNGTRTYTYSYTDCASHISNWAYTYTISAPTITITSCPPAQTYCSTVAGTYTIPAIVATANCGGVLSYSYTITDSTSRIGVGSDASGMFNIGVSTITWTVTDACGNTSNCNTQVTINAIDNPAFNYTPSTMCQTGADQSAVITGGATGTFTASPAGLVFLDATTGLIDVSASTLNSYTITFATNGACPSDSTSDIIITSAPDATFSYAGPYCSNGTDPFPVFPIGASAGTFSATPTGLVFVNTSPGK